MEMSAEPSAAPIIDRDGQKSSFKGYAFSQMEDNIGIQEDIIRHNLPKSKESSTTQVNQLNPLHEPVPTSAVLYVRKETWKLTIEKKTKLKFLFYAFLQSFFYKK